MKRLSITFLLLASIVIHTQAQITVADDNNVGIGETSPESELSVNGTGNTYSTFYVKNTNAISSQRAGQFFKDNCGGDYSFSVLGKTTVNGGGNKLMGAKFLAYASNELTSDRTYGVYGVAGNALDGYNYAVYGWLYGNKKGAAVFGCTDGLDVNVGDKWAGYFKGKVRITDSLIYTTMAQNSDIQLKKDIRLLTDESGAQMSRLKSLSAIKYKIKNPAELFDENKVVFDTSKIDPRTIEYTAGIYTRDHVGFSAQAVQEIYPELVGTGNDGYLNVNYIGMIPILVVALKEQDLTIDSLSFSVQTHEETLQLHSDSLLTQARALKSQALLLQTQSETVQLQSETIQAMDDVLKAQAEDIKVLKEEIDKLKNAGTTE